MNAPERSVVAVLARSYHSRRCKANRKLLPSVECQVGQELDPVEIDWGHQPKAALAEMEVDSARHVSVALVSEQPPIGARAAVRHWDIALVEKLAK